MASAQGEIFAIHKLDHDQAGFHGVQASHLNV